jgi:hypothetical protein
MTSAVEGNSGVDVDQLIGNTQLPAPTIEAELIAISRQLNADDDTGMWVAEFPPDDAIAVAATSHDGWDAEQLRSWRVFLVNRPQACRIIRASDPQAAIDFVSAQHGLTEQEQAFLVAEPV